MWQNLKEKNVPNKSLSMKNLNKSKAFFIGLALKK